LDVAAHGLRMLPRVRLKRLAPERPCGPSRVWAPSQCGPSLRARRFGGIETR
jgi:hypothetical protein